MGQKEYNTRSHQLQSKTRNIHTNLLNNFMPDYSLQCGRRVKHLVVTKGIGGPVLRFLHHSWLDARQVEFLT